MQKINEVIKKIWRTIRMPIYIILALLACLTIYRIPYNFEKDDTVKIVADIHNQKLTMSDVDGKTNKSAA